RQGIHVDGGQYIYVFSLKGEPLCSYVLDHFVNGISVDEQQGIILATDVNKDEPVIEYRPLHRLFR
ncbi:BF3164 family lipoprotein, partial [uncultured Bacteroides sp.]